MVFMYMLAPMEDFTDPAFRTLSFKCGADMTFTEMASIEALAKGVENTLEKIRTPDDTPTQIQLVGNKEALLKKFLDGYRPENGFAGINLNLGCPDPEIIRRGMGCAMIKRITKVKTMVEMIRKKGYPVSIKLRLGLNQYEKDHKVYIRLIESVDADFFIVHARHGKQKYDDPADFSIYEGCVRTGKTIIANGDIRTQEDIEMLMKIGVQGAMIGREATRDPRIFAKLKGNDCSLDMKKEYGLLSERFGAPGRYKNNLFKRMAV
jgi:tRNA-dihydrouridine synthase B